MLARDSSKSQPSAKGALNRPLVDGNWRQLSGRTHTYLFCVRALHSVAALSYCDIKVTCRDFCSSIVCLSIKSILNRFELNSESQMAYNCQSGLMQFAFASVSAVHKALTP